VGKRTALMARKRVLIVDDEALSRAVLRVFLTTAGYEPSEAVDGTEGLAKARELRPDLILLDVRMPGLDGIEVCRGLKESPETAHIPVIFVTAVEDAALNRLAFQAGGDAWLTKPFRREALLAVIEATLASAERQAKPKAKDGEDGH
jgi:CheY-like chemotaxis protein